MRRICLLFLFSLFFQPETAFAGSKHFSIIDPGNPADQDTAGKQIIYTGRLWRNQYYLVRGDQFLFTASLLKGTVIVNGRLFSDVLLNYDIYNDEIIALNDNGMMIQLNKEKVEEFNIEYNLRTYKFRNLDSDSLRNIDGYVNVLFDDELSLVVKYKKEIVMLAVENKYDEFNQLHRLYLRKDSVYYPIRGRRDLIKHLKDKKQQLRSFIRTNKLLITRNNPDSFIPVLEYYTNLKNNAIR